MTDYQRIFLSVIHASLEQTTASIPDTFDFERAYQTARMQQIIPLFYYGAAQSPAFLASSVSERFFSDTCKLLARSERQNTEIQKICKAFEAKGIDFCCLKGAILQNLYPQKGMRVMGDADILIRIEQYEQIKPIMLSLGYTEGIESDHELIWNKAGALHVELHKRLIPSYNKDYNAYYLDSWNRIKNHEMSPEDLFIYLLTHFAKHYRDTGAGVKYITDLYLFEKHYPNLNRTYLEQELSLLKLSDFYRNLSEMIGVWFEGKESTKMSDFLTDRILSHGVWGTKENSTLSQGLKYRKANTSARKAKMIALLFPPYAMMCKRYPTLQTVPVLLPFFWISRWCDTLLFRRKNLRKQCRSLKRMSEENIQKYQRDLNYVGLDYHFE